MSESLTFRPVEWTLNAVHVEMADFLDGKLTKVNKRLAKLGAPLATLTYGPVVERSRKSEFGWGNVTWHEYETVTVTGVEAQFAGWTGVASLDHSLDEHEALVSRFPGQEETEMPEAFRFRGPVCDHCKIAIPTRKTTVLFVNESGEWMQVGTSCVLDFIGVDPSTVLWLGARFVGGEDDDEYEGARSSCRYEVSPHEFLAAAAEVTRLFGFVKSRPDSMYVTPTRQDAHTLCYGRLSDAEKKRFADVEFARGSDMADKVMAWVAESTDGSDFMTSARLACRTWKATDKTEGLLACLPYIYLREMGKLAERAAVDKAAGKPEGHVGTVNAKLTVEGVVTFKASYEPYHYNGPTSYRITMTTDEGYSVTTFGSGNTLWECEVGDRIEMTGKVKELSTSDRYGNQTVVKMAKVRVLQEAA